MFAALTPDYFGENYNATNYGLVYSGKLISGLFGGGLGSMVVAAWGYDGAYALAGGISMVAAAIALLLRQPGRSTADASAPQPRAGGLSARGPRWRRPSSRHGEEGRFATVRGPAPPRLGEGPSPVLPCLGYASLPPNAASNEADGGSKSYALSRFRASGAPWSRSMPASSHSTEIGPW